MAIRIATFNANNLFSRWSFQTELPRTVNQKNLATLKAADSAAEAVVEHAATTDEPVSAPDVVEVTLPDGTKVSGVLRTFRGKLVRGKDPKARAWIARRIHALDADVLCLQEVEDQNALDVFHRDDLVPLGIRYPFRMVIEGNDPRRIDVAICSKLPITRVSSWRFFPDPTGDAVFGRDLLQAEIMAPDGKPLRVFVNHLKSNFVTDEFRLTPAQVEKEREEIAERRSLQAKAIRTILRRQRLDTRIVLTGDMNDAPDAPTLSPLSDLGLTEQISGGTTIAGPNRKGVLVDDAFGNLSDHMWTNRHRAKGEVSFNLYDQIWTSPDLTVAAAHVMRRTLIGGDGSDHDPACVDVEL